MDMKVVFLGSSSSVFVVRTAEELRSRGVEVQLIDPYAASARVVGKSILTRLLRLLFRVWFTFSAARKLNQEQVVVIHSLGLNVFWIAPLLRRYFKKIVGLAYGSDILRRNKRFDPLLEIGLRNLDCVAATNTNVLETILNDFPIVSKKSTRIIRFGLPVFDAIEKNILKSQEEARAQLGFPAENPLICLGYSASSGQRQKDLIDFFAEQTELHGKYQFVVPVQYGSTEVKLAVVEDCLLMNKKLGKEVFHPLTEFYDPDTSALMRIATTVLINHSVSDAFSGTVQEIIYSGNMVLACKHLPYDDMPGFNTAIKPYYDLTECVSALHADEFSQWRKITEDALEENRAGLRKCSSWDGTIQDWFNIIDLSN